MRTTVQIDEDLMAELRQRAETENLSPTHLIKRLLRSELACESELRRESTGQFCQRTHAMGVPRIDLNRVISFAAVLEDKAILRKLASGL
jgi:hypothetical protein